MKNFSSDSWACSASTIEVILRKVGSNVSSPYDDK